MNLWFRTTVRLYHFWMQAGFQRAPGYPLPIYNESHSRLGPAGQFKGLVLQDLFASATRRSSLQMDYRTLQTHRCLGNWSLDPWVENLFYWALPSLTRLSSQWSACQEALRDASSNTLASQVQMGRPNSEWRETLKSSDWTMSALRRLRWSSSDLRVCSLK